MGAAAPGPSLSPVALPPADDGTKTSRTTTMESSYVKRSDSKSFCCPFPAASSGLNPRGIAAAEPSLPVVWAEPPHLPGTTSLGSCLRPLFLSLSLQVATAHSFKLNHPIALLPRRQAGERWCLPGASPKWYLSSVCLHKPSLPSLRCPCAGMSPKPPGPWGTLAVSSSPYGSLHGDGDVSASRRP